MKLYFGCSDFKNEVFGLSRVYCTHSSELPKYWLDMLTQWAFFWGEMEV